MYFPTSAALIEFLILAILEQRGSIVMRLAKPLNSLPKSRVYPLPHLEKLNTNHYLTTYSRRYQVGCRNTTPAQRD